MIKYFRKIFFIYFILRFRKLDSNINFNDLNFRKLDFTNYKQIKFFIFKKNFYKINNKFVHNFEFLNFSNNLGGKIGINLSRDNIFAWYSMYKNKMAYPWSDDMTSKRLINIIYNYEFINSTSNKFDSKKLSKIINHHMLRVMEEFNNKKFDEISSYDLVAYLLSVCILNKSNNKTLEYINFIISNNIDDLGMHKSYNILEHAKYINNLNEIKNISLYFNLKLSNNIDDFLVKMTSILNEYFHHDGSIPLFNGANNNYTDIINKSLNSLEYLRSREFSNNKNGIAFYSDKEKKVFMDVIQPDSKKNSNNSNAGTLSFEFSTLNEKIITNCGASESYGKNPEYLRYSAAHSTIILQNTNISEIKENQPHIKFPQSVTFNSSKDKDNVIFEGSHNGYANKFKRILKRKLSINRKKIYIEGEDSIICLSNKVSRIFYHIRFHLVYGISYNFTNNKKNIILKTKMNNIWMFKSNLELSVEDSILVDNNKTLPIKQIVIKNISRYGKQTVSWSLEKV